MKIPLAALGVSMMLCGCGGATHRSPVTAVHEACEGPNRALVTGGGQSACVKYRDSRNLQHEVHRLEAKWCPKERHCVRVTLSQEFNAVPSGAVPAR